MSSAGWMATTINYYWSLGAILINLYYLKKANNLIKLKWYEYIISSIALLFAANQEQGFAILLGTYFFYIIYCFINKRKISFFCNFKYCFNHCIRNIYLYMSWKLGEKETRS